jgi:hypothetical protein
MNDMTELEEKLFDAEAAKRLKTNSKVYSDKEVRGKAADDNSPLDPNDGWE